jgi:hypothetical protein
MAAAAALIGAFALFFVYDLGFAGISLKHYWYFSNVLPMVAIVTLAMVVRVAGAVPARYRDALLGLAILGLILFTLGRVQERIDLTDTGLGAFLPRITIVLAAHGVRTGAGPGLARAVALVAAVMSGQAVATHMLLQKSDLASLYDRRFSEDIDIFRAVNRFIAAMPDEAVDPGDLRILIASTVPHRDRIIGSAYFDPYGAIVDRDLASLVTLDHPDERITDYAGYLKTRYFIGIAPTLPELAGFADCMAAHGLPCRVVRLFALDFRDGRVQVVVLERQSFVPTLIPVAAPP